MIFSHNPQGNFKIYSSTNRVLNLQLMPKIQAHFTDKATAERARAALVATGVAASRIHIWNNIAGGAPFAANRDDATEGGAILGGALGGVAGLVAGAALGSTYESGGNSSTPTTAGVRLVVEGDAADGDDTDSDIEKLLREHGATDVQQRDDT